MPRIHSRARVRYCRGSTPNFLFRRILETTANIVLPPGGSPRAQIPLLRRTDRRRSPTSRDRNPVAEITLKLGISEATLYVWKKRFGTLGTPKIRKLRQMRHENAKLKAVVADLTLDRAVLQDVIKNKC